MTLKKAKQRLLSDTPKWTKYVQLLLASVAGYNAFVITNPDMLHVVPDGWEQTVAGLSGFTAFILQMINKPKADGNN